MIAGIFPGLCVDNTWHHPLILFYQIVPTIRLKTFEAFSKKKIMEFATLQIKIIWLMFRQKCYGCNPSRAIKNTSQYSSAQCRSYVLKWSSILTTVYTLHCPLEVLYSVCVLEWRCHILNPTLYTHIVYNTGLVKCLLK